MNRSVVIFCGLLSVVLCGLCEGQEQSVRPGVNDSFRSPNVKDFVERFESEGREVYANREEIIRACAVEPGMSVGDVGAGTGLFTRLFSSAVGNDGTVYAVDISDDFIENILTQAEAAGTSNIKGVICADDDTKLAPSSVDLVYICDTYHHFEFPMKTMTSIYKALKPGGRVVLIDFKRETGVSSGWIMNHVRAGQATVRKEIESVGFEMIAERKDILKDNYFMIFQPK